MKKIVILSIFLIILCSITYNIQAEKSQKIYTAKEFLELLRDTKKYLSGNNFSRRYASGSQNYFKDIYRIALRSATSHNYHNAEKAKKERESYYKDLINSCKMNKKISREYQDQDKNLFGVFSVQIPGSDIIKKFTIQDPDILNNTNVIDQIIKETKPETDSFFNALEKISLAMNQLKQIQTTVNIYEIQIEIQIENTRSIQTLSKSSAYKKYKYKKRDLIRRSTRQLARNIDDFISLMKTADGFLKECQDVLFRIKELCIKGLKTDTTDKEINKIIPKIWKWTDECDRITEMAQFNTKTLFFTEDKHFRKFSIALNESRASEYFTFYSPQYVDEKNILNPYKIKNIDQYILNHTVPKEIMNNKKAALKMIKRISSGTEICLKNILSQREKIKIYQKYLKEEKDKILKIYDNTSSD